jgi:hypothetical protein
VLIFQCLLGADILKYVSPGVGALLLLYPFSGMAGPVYIIDAGYIVPAGLVTRRT